MTLNRRKFSAVVVGGGLTGLLAPAAAQPAVVEGVNYVKLAQPAPVADRSKIEVVEFFWYECPHCSTFEPALEAWVQKLPPDVNFRRVPVWFRDEPFTTQQRLYYAIETLGLVPTLHRRVFYAIHNERERLRTPEDIAAFVTKHGVDPVKFMAAYSSFSVQTRAQQARQLGAAYKIDAVPAMGVQGRYYTTGSLASAGGPPPSAGGANERMLGVVDALIVKARQGN